MLFAPFDERSQYKVKKNVTWSTLHGTQRRNGYSLQRKTTKQTLGPLRGDIIVGKERDRGTTRGYERIDILGV